LKEILFILLIVFSIILINTPRIRRLAIFICVFSIICSIIYLIHGAPDVSIAEAIIGSTIATILYLVALQKYRYFKIYYTIECLDGIDNNGETEQQNVISTIEDFCRFKHLEPQFIYSMEPLERIISQSDFDLIVRNINGVISIYGKLHHYQLDTLQNYLEDRKDLDFNYEIKTVVDEEE
jgi:putative multicomponent Na+:H+ antiporter subunit B